MNRPAHLATLALAAAVLAQTVLPAATPKPAPKDAPAKTAPAKPQEKPAAESWIKTASGLEYIEQKVGTGALAEAGKTVLVHYTGWLLNGAKFDSSLDRGVPLQFQLGAGQVIRGWDEGIAGMKVGGKRKLRIPPQLAYGDSGAGGVIPPGATLLFDVELVGVR